MENNQRDECLSKIKEWACDNDYQFRISKTNIACLEKNRYINGKEQIDKLLIYFNITNILNGFIQTSDLTNDFKQIRNYKKSLRIVKKDMKNLKKYLNQFHFNVL